MVAVTYGREVTSPAATAAPKRKNLLARFLSALMESRMRAAERQIQLYRHLLPGQLENAGDRLTQRTEDKLPFGGW
jgi:hypothetical protein